MSTPQKQTPRWNGANANTKKASDSIVDDSFDVDKPARRLQAQFALAGYEMRFLRNADGRVIYSIQRWGESRIVSTLHDAMSFYVQIGGKP